MMVTHLHINGKCWPQKTGMYPYPEKERSTKEVALPWHIRNGIRGGVGWGRCACLTSSWGRNNLILEEAKKEVAFF